MVTAAKPGMSDDAVKAATGRDWSEWRMWIEVQGGADMTHKEIASMLHKSGVPGWWSQMITVGYERMTGKRAVGQRCDGAYSASASKTITSDKDVALRKWLSVVDGLAEFGGVLAETEPRQSQSEKWRYWKVDLDDGSKVQVTISDKPVGKAIIGIGHEKLADLDAVARSKAYWKQLLFVL